MEALQTTSGVLNVLRLSVGSRVKVGRATLQDFIYCNRKQQSDNGNRDNRTFLFDNGADEEL